MKSYGLVPSPFVLCALALSTSTFAQQPPDPVPAAEVPAAEIPEIPAAKRNLIRFVSDQAVRVTEPSEDLFAMGQRVVVASSVDDNTFAMGQEVSVESPVFGDLFALGETVRIEAPVSGDVYSFAKTLIVTERGSVGGDILGGGAVVQIEGPVKGDLELGAGEIVLAAPVGGSADLEVGQIHLEPGGLIGGNLDYTSSAAIDGLDAVVSGEVKFTQEVAPADDWDEPEEKPSLLSNVLWGAAFMIWSYAAKLIVGFVLLLLGGASAGKVAHTLIEQPARAMGLGFVALCVLPAASVVAIVTILPMSLGFLGLLALGVVMYIGQIFAAQAVGDLILRRLRPGALGSPYISMAVGMVPLVLLAAIPWIGTLSWFAATVAGMGALWVAARPAPAEL